MEDLDETTRRFESLDDFLESLKSNAEREKDELMYWKLDSIRLRLLSVWDSYIEDLNRLV